MSGHAVWIDERTNDGRRLKQAHQRARMRAAERRWAWEDRRRGYTNPYTSKRSYTRRRGRDDTTIVLLLILALLLSLF